MIIYKYEIPISRSFSIMMPGGAQILSFQVQRNTPCIWCLVNPNIPVEERKFKVIGAGNSFDDSWLQYIGTIQQDEFVWHLFEDLTW